MVWSTNDIMSLSQCTLDEICITGIVIEMKNIAQKIPRIYVVPKSTQSRTVGVAFSWVTYFLYRNFRSCPSNQLPKFGSRLPIVFGFHSQNYKIYKKNYKIIHT